MSFSNPIGPTANLAPRIRMRREELRLTREELVEQIAATPGKHVSLSIIKAMEKPGADGYRLPKRKWGRGLSALEIVAQALSVPIGYLLAGFSEEEIANSQYGRAVQAGRIELVPVLRDQDQQPESLTSFLENLPTTESELFDLPLHSYKNQFAAAIIFRIERFYPGLEMLIVNDPPFIFWDDDDIRLWAENMNIGQRDRLAFFQEFSNYRTYFRSLAQQRKKRYKVVVNFPTFSRFLHRKTEAARRAIAEDICNFLRLSNFNLVFHHPTSDLPSAAQKALDILIEAHECEVLCKATSIPASLEGTVSIQILASPPHQKPVGYFVGPAPIDMILIQREVGRIDNAWAAALDQYRLALNKPASPVGQLSDSEVRSHTASILRSI